LNYPVIRCKPLVTASHSYRLLVEVEWYEDHSTIVGHFYTLIARGLC
jgi:hypothetical protein